MDPFEDVERGIRAAIERQLAQVKALDEMDRDVTSWEAGFLDSVLKQLKVGRPLSQKQIETLNNMSTKYEVE